ncbi:glycosyltransferase family 4 protein [Patescibacteria group bacterium]|nr:glycosyltransferase family 4 protein [Patescibacteria group bacterium]
MVIGIDASAILSSKKTGVEVVTTDLIKAILRNDKTNTYWLYSPMALPVDIITNERVINVVIPGKRFWTQIYLRNVIKKNPPNIFWSPSHILPALPRQTKGIATIHDLAWYLLPQGYTWKNRLMSWLTVRRAIQQADHLIAVSQQTKKDLKKYFKVAGDDVAVIYHALRSDWSNDDTDPKLGDYLLFVGRIEFRKNILQLIKAFQGFAESHPQIKLVLAGSPGYGYNHVQKLIKRLKLSANVINLSYVPSQILPGLYRHALGVVYPSLYEGFGLTILEGFAANVPVMTADIGGTKEIAGNAALLINPLDVDEINLGLHRLVDDKDLRNSLIAKGKQRLTEFNWDLSAQKIIDLWQHL